MCQRNELIEGGRPVGSCGAVRGLKALAERAVPGARGCPARPASGARLVAGSRCSGSGAARQPWKTVRPAVHSCTDEVTPGRAGASAVRTRPIDPCRWGRIPCPTSLERSQVGDSVTHRFDADRPEAQQQRDAAWVERAPTPLLNSSSMTRTGAPSAVCPLRESPSTARLHPTLQVSNGAPPSLARPVAATGGVAARPASARWLLPRRVVADAVQPRQETRSKLCL